jgi:hypothetical protein
MTVKVVFHPAVERELDELLVYWLLAARPLIQPQFVQNFLYAQIAI